MLEKTTLFRVDEIENALIETTLDEVSDALREKGYNPVNQIVGYLLTGDAGYITSHKGARNKITNVQREKLLETIVKDYLGV